MTQRNDASRVDPALAVDKAERSEAAFSVDPACSNQGSGPASDAPAPPRETFMTKEWCIAAAEREGDGMEVGVGGMPDPAWRLTRARSALECYGWHHSWCDYLLPIPEGRIAKPCNCGYEQAITDLAASPAQEATPPRCEYCGEPESHDMHQGRGKLFSRHLFSPAAPAREASTAPGARSCVAPLTDRERHFIAQRISNHEAGHDTGLTERAVLYLRGYEATVAALTAERGAADRVHLRRHARLAEALGMDPGYSVDATINAAIAKLNPSQD